MKSTQEIMEEMPKLANWIDSDSHVETTNKDACKYKTLGPNLFIENANCESHISAFRSILRNGKM